MEIKEAVLAFSQGEKIKSGLIWATHAVERGRACSDVEKRGADQIIAAMVQMIGHEVSMIRGISGNNPWLEIEKNIDMAAVMINSGVAGEAAFHLTRALSKVTNVCQRAMTFLQEKNLL